MTDKRRTALKKQPPDWRGFEDRVGARIKKMESTIAKKVWKELTKALKRGGR